MALMRSNTNIVECFSFLNKKHTCNNSSYQNLLFASVGFFRLSCWVGLREMKVMDCAAYVWDTLRVVGHPLEPAYKLEMFESGELQLNYYPRALDHVLRSFSGDSSRPADRRQR